MKGIVKLALATVAVVGVAAQSHQHNHGHRHQYRHEHAEGVGRRDIATVTSVVAGLVVLVYVLDGQVIDAAQAAQGIEDGLYVVVGKSMPDFLPPVPSMSSSAGDQFFEQKTATASTAAPSPTSTSTSTSTRTTSMSTSTPAPTPPGPGPAQPTPGSSSTGSGSGLNSDFPSGKIRCSAGVPTDYGPIRLDYLKLDGWSGVQCVGPYKVDVPIGNVVTKVSGACTPGCFCSYAGPPGYQKTQWPESSQNARGITIGGLYCNSEGFLELTRPSHPHLCEPGAGGVYVQNTMTRNCSLCRTDYPGSEDMVIPLETQPGQTYPLTNVDASTYFKWEGKTTSAQYYVNPKGVSMVDSCLWRSPTNPLSAGNLAPVNIGVGMDSAGITYISIFPNAPTSTAKLDFDIEITGDVSSQCYLRNGVYAGGSNGCTTAMTSGGKATIVFSE